MSRIIYAMRNKYNCCWDTGVKCTTTAWCSWSFRWCWCLRTEKSVGFCSCGNWWGIRDRSWWKFIGLAGLGLSNQTEEASMSFQISIPLLCIINFRRTTPWCIVICKSTIIRMILGCLFSIKSYWFYFYFWRKNELIWT
jgi:hypothetical protein